MTARGCDELAESCLWQRNAKNEGLIPISRMPMGDERGSFKWAMKSCSSSRLNGTLIG